MTRHRIACARIAAVGDKIRYGMVGGGEGAFIGAVHRSAASLDGTLELVCGAFSSHPERSRQTGDMLRLDPERCYADYDTMFQREADRPVGERMEFVTIVTPNHLHFPVARAALESPRTPSESRSFRRSPSSPARIALGKLMLLRRRRPRWG